MANIGSDSSFTDPDAIEGQVHEYAMVSVEGELEATRTIQSTMFAELTGASRAPRNSRMWVDYRTFIPPARVSSPFFCANGTGKYFNGNNRGWSSPRSSVNYKTKTLARIDFAARRVSLSKGVSTTRLYSSQTSSTVRKSGRASLRDVYVSAPRINSSSATFTVKHSVGNPLCWAAGPIWYQYTATAYNTGSMSIYGYRRRAPSHEMWVVGSNGGWKVAAQRSHQSFFCLNFNCGTDSWTKYFNKSVL